MSQRKPGLWHGPRRVEVEAVKRRMRKVCSRCGDTPENFRLRVVNGVGRSAKVSIYCVECGDVWLRHRMTEAGRARHLLRTGKGAVRSGTTEV